MKFNRSIFGLIFFFKKNNKNINHFAHVVLMLII